MSLELLFNLEKNQFKDKSDLLVCCIHSVLIQNGYKCIGHGENEETTLDQFKPSDMLPKNWNSNQEVYSLFYIKQQTSEHFLLKVLNIEQLILCHFSKVGTNMVANLDFIPSDHYTDDLLDFDKAFVNMQETLFLIEKSLVQPYNERPKSSSPKREARKSDKESNILSDSRRSPDGLFARHIHDDDFDNGFYNPCSIGRNDLDPLAGMRGGPGFGRIPGGRGGGMIFDPFRDPSCFPGVPRGFHPPNIPGHIPRGSIPPGARFDPFGPLPDKTRTWGPTPDHMKKPDTDSDDMFS